MKKFILYFIFCSVWICVQGNKPRTISGSWINTNVTNYYETGKGHSCDIKYFGSDKFVPLYLSFDTGGKVKITYRIEQEIFTYKITYSNSDSILISRGENVYKIYLVNDLLELRYNDNLITFRKVSDSYSNDVFGEFVKGLIFSNHKTYRIDSFKENLNYNNAVVRKNNFQQRLKEIFGCYQAEVAQLGSFKFGEYCLPEIALYYNGKSKWGSLRTMGIIIGKDDIKFVDNSGANILTFKPK